MTTFYNTSDVVHSIFHPSLHRRKVSSNTITDFGFTGALLMKKSAEYHIMRVTILIKSIMIKYCIKCCINTSRISIQQTLYD